LDLRPHDVEFLPVVGETEVLDEQEDLIEVILEANIELKQFLHQFPQSVLQIQVQEDNIPQFIEVFMVVLVFEPPPELRDLPDLAQNVPVVHVFDGVVTQALQVSGQLALDLVKVQPEVVAGVHFFQDLQVVVEVWDRSRHESGLFRYSAFVRSQSLPTHTLLPEHSPVLTHIIGPQIGQQGHADRNIIRRRVIMQFLVPLLVEMSRPLAYFVSVHDVQNFVSDTLPVSRPFAD